MEMSEIKLTRFKKTKSVGILKTEVCFPCLKEFKFKRLIIQHYPNNILRQKEGPLETSIMTSL
jgi:hypothetical protein